MAPRRSDDDRVLHSGLLFKRGSGKDYPFGRMNWKTRYVVLTPSTLKYFKYEGGPWKGEVNLVSGDTNKLHHPAHRTTIEVMPADSKKTGKSASTIWRIAVNTKERRLLLAATSEIEMNQWVEKLLLALRIGRSEHSQDRELAFEQLHQHQYHHRQHRRSLPDVIATASNTFITDFQGSVQAPSQRRQSIGVTSEGSAAVADILSQRCQEDLWEQPSTFVMSATMPSPDSLVVSSPQEPGEFDNHQFSTQSDFNVFSDQDSLVATSTTTPSRFKQARGQSDPHQRLSLPSAVEAYPFTTSVLESERRVPPPPHFIADFSNFARSRRRRSVVTGERGSEPASLGRRQYSAGAFEHEIRHGWEPNEFEHKFDEVETEDDARSEVTAGDYGKRTSERSRRFTRFRRWLFRREQLAC